MKSENGEIHKHEPTFPAPLIPNATATFYFDGLIFATYNRRRRLYQAGIHTGAEHHGLKVQVTTDDGRNVVWPRTPEDWDQSLEVVKGIAPLWFYVDAGNGLRPEEFNATLFKPNELHNERSFGHVLDFEDGLYKRRLELRPEPLAAFNFPHGVFYSAKNTTASLLAFEQGQTHEQGKPVKDLKVSTLGGCDIESRSEEGAEAFIVLAKHDGAEEIFRLPLVEGTHYEISVMNIPLPGHEHPTPEEHFLQFYELFPLKEGEKVFLVDPADAPVNHPHDPSVPLPSPHSPPCIQGRGSLGDELPSA